jgi:hypothetical protein
VLPISVGVTVSANQRVAFYITTQNQSLGSGNIYTDGSGVGNLYASNADLEFYEGVGNQYPFAGTFTPRVWNGTIYYTCH